MEFARVASRRGRCSSWKASSEKALLDADAGESPVGTTAAGAGARSGTSLLDSSCRMSCWLRFLASEENREEDDDEDDKAATAGGPELLLRLLLFRLSPAPQRRTFAGIGDPPVPPDRLPWKATSATPSTTVSVFEFVPAAAPPGAAGAPARAEPDAEGDETEVED